jgi:hypothetical protein
MDSIGRGSPRRSPAPSPASDDNRANLQDNLNSPAHSSDTPIFQWPNGCQSPLGAGGVWLWTWCREPGLTPRGVIGFADVEFPRRGVCRSRLRSRRGRVWVEWAGNGVAISWREVNERYAWLIVYLITEVDPGARADDGSIPYIPSPPSWGVP